MKSAGAVAPIRLLLVDDDTSVREMVAMTLHQTPREYSIMQASSGNEAISLLEKHSYDLIISDVTMDDGTGLDLLKFLVQTRSETPLIFFTGNPRQSLPVKEEAPLLAIVEKSVPWELVDVVESCVAESKAERRAK